ncbi:MAG: molybdopterin-dependent oxidoreductase [Candidatus Thorarchaeota archaeon]
MNRNLKIIVGIAVVGIVVLVLFQPFLFPTNPPGGPSGDSEFPDFFTSNEDYYITRIGSVPNIDRDTYRLEITGFVDNPRSFNLVELRALNLTDLPLTIECIGNGPNGKLIGTAMWRGFNVYDLLVSLGLAENATGVRYTAADGYYASHTMDQLRDNQVLGALYMNGVEIPQVQGFPLRILNPGYYGVKQPAWVTGIEVIDRPLEDYWQDRGWDTSPPMDIDSMIFFPTSPTTVNVSEVFRVGGCAFGGTRVKLVEYTLDNGGTWFDAPIVQQIDADNVWVFWEFTVSFQEVGQVTIKTRATDINDVQQIPLDSQWQDGTSSWPSITINVI